LVANGLNFWPPSEFLYFQGNNWNVELKCQWNKLCSKFWRSFFPDDQESVIILIKSKFFFGNKQLLKSNFCIIVFYSTMINHPIFLRLAVWARHLAPKSYPVSATIDSQNVSNSFLLCLHNCHPFSSEGNKSPSCCD